MLHCNSLHNKKWTLHYRSQCHGKHPIKFSLVSRSFFFFHATLRPSSLFFVNGAAVCGFLVIEWCTVCMYVHHSRLDFRFLRWHLSALIVSCSYAAEFLCFVLANWKRAHVTRYFYWRVFTSNYKMRGLFQKRTEQKELLSALFFLLVFLVKVQT